MIVVLKPKATRAQIESVIEEVKKLGYKPHPIFGVERTVVAAIGDERVKHTLETLTAMPMVDQVMPVQRRYKFVSREANPKGSKLDILKNVFGGKKFQMIAGPCSVGSERQI